jgi:hypothetical protein
MGCGVAKVTDERGGVMMDRCPELRVNKDVEKQIFGAAGEQPHLTRK